MREKSEEKKEKKSDESGKTWEFRSMKVTSRQMKKAMIMTTDYSGFLQSLQVRTSDWAKKWKLNTLTSVPKDSVRWKHRQARPSFSEKSETVSEKRRGNKSVLDEKKSTTNTDVVNKRKRRGEVRHLQR